ncbi:MAG TPA: hypothetical protein P5280_02985 [Cyclobacteriaceae bacterium]|nr:hypothetical protein [Cyclobacteriaceae bacterium]
MKQQLIYIDTSVVGGVFDEEFAHYSKLLFDNVIAGEYKILISDILEQELEQAPDRVVAFFADIPEDVIIRVELTEAADLLAAEYLAADVVGATSRTDCQHIAIATIAGADILVSWNFKHIVNVLRIRGYNSVNLINGFRQLEIRDPRALVGI